MTSDERFQELVDIVGHMAQVQRDQLELTKAQTRELMVLQEALKAEKHKRQQLASAMIFILLAFFFTFLFAFLNYLSPNPGLLAFALCIAFAAFVFGAVGVVFVTLE